MDFKELESFLLARTSSKYQRSNYDQFLKKIGFDFSIPSVHVTGSNGKGSTCTFLRNIYQASGRKVGLFISPFFYHPNEMISVNGVSISNDDFLLIFNRFEKEILKNDLTAFEIETFIAFSYFKEKACDMCIIEVGMGGLIDATNIFTPVLSIVTSICLEHTSYLGTTYSEIAANKGGIIKDKVPVLVGKLEETADQTLRDIASSHDSKYFVVDGYYFLKQNGDGFDFDYRPYTSLFAPVKISSQITDASLAIEATKILQNSFPVSENNIRDGLKSFSLICRGERFGNVFIDGAHNVEAAEELSKNFKNIAKNGEPIHILFAAFRDKNISAILPILAKDAASINLTTFDHPRAREEMDYFLYTADYPFNENWKEELFNLKNTYPDDIILVTGSLAFVGQVREFLNESKID